MLATHPRYDDYRATQTDESAPKPTRHLIPVTYGAWPCERGALLRTPSRMPAYVPGSTRVRFVRG